MPDYEKALFRLAIRGEGEMVTAYFAPADTMAGALLLGSIKRNLCEKCPQLFDDWKALMTGVLATATREALGVDPKMIEEPAPQHERAGRA